MSATPRARTERLVTEQVGDELLVYDEVNQTAHVLAPRAASVWQQCDGTSTLEEIARSLALEEAQAADALAQLQGAGLLEQSERVTRRQASKRIAAAGAAAVGAPLIYAVAVPSAAAAMTPPAPPPMGVAYVANRGTASGAGAGTTVSVVNTTTNQVIDTITVGTRPLGVAASPNGRRVYVANSGSGTVSVIDTATNTVLPGPSGVPAGSTIAVGNNPVAVAVSPVGDRAYVVNMNSNSVSVIDTATNTVIDTLTRVTATGAQAFFTPAAIAVSPDGSYVYVGNNNSLSRINVNTVTNTYTVTAPFAVGISAVAGIAFSPSSNAYVTVPISTVRVYNPANTQIATIGVATGPTGIALSPDGSRGYVASPGQNAVSVINPADNTLITTLVAPIGAQNFFLGPRYLAVSPDGSFVYVSNTGGSSLSRINAATLAVTPGAVGGLSAPAGIAFATPPAPSTVVPPVFAAYVDNLSFRPGASPLPTPWQGTGGVEFVGCGYSGSDNCPKIGGVDSYDTGALRLDNDTNQPVTVTGASVTIGSCQFDPWPGLDVTVPAGDKLILTQTGGPTPCGLPVVGDYNFDTSETNTTNDVCTNDGLIPEFHVTVDDQAPLTYADTGQVLNTGGTDPGVAACGYLNESHDTWEQLSALSARHGHRRHSHGHPHGHRPA